MSCLPLSVTWQTHQRTRLITFRVFAVVASILVVFRVFSDRNNFPGYGELACWVYFTVASLNLRVREHLTSFYILSGAWMAGYVFTCVILIFSPALFPTTNGAHSEYRLVLATRVNLSPILAIICLISVAGVNVVTIAFVSIGLVASTLTTAGMCYTEVGGNAAIICGVMSYIIVMWIALLHLLFTLEAFRNEISKRSTEPTELSVVVGNSVFQQNQRVVSYLFHEVRNPINNIILAAEAMRQEVSQTSLPLVDLVDSILNAAAGARYILNDALNLQRLQDGTFTFTFQPFMLVDMHREVITTFQAQINERNITLSMCIDESLPDLLVMGDSHRIQQVLSNFFSNAIKYTPHGGHVELCLKNMDRERKSVLRKGSGSSHGSGSGFGLGVPIHTVTVRTSVYNSGSRIADENKLKIFQPWSHVRAGHHDEVGLSSGLGLSLCKEFIEKGHNGRIWVESDQSGTTFFFEISYPVTEISLPTTPPRRETAIEKECSECGGDEVEGSVDVLVVEDSSLTRRLLGKALLSLGLTWAECENGQQAVELMSGGLHCRIVFMDKEMPVMDGYVATKHLRQCHVTVPIIGITGNAMDEQVVEFLSAGVDEVIPKPVDRNVIENVLLRYKILPKS